MFSGIRGPAFREVELPEVGIGAHAEIKFLAHLGERGLISDADAGFVIATLRIVEAILHFHKNRSCGDLGYRNLANRPLG